MAKKPPAREKLGSVTIDVYRREDGSFDVGHEVWLSAALNEMMATMSPAEVDHAEKLVRSLTDAAAVLFLFMRNPDAKKQAAAR